MVRWSDFLPRCLGAGGGASEDTLPGYACPVWGLCVLVSAVWEERRCDRLSERHQVSQHLIRAAMKGPPTVRLRSAVHINQEEIFFEPENK